MPDSIAVEVRRAARPRQSPSWTLAGPWLALSVMMFSIGISAVVNVAVVHAEEPGQVPCGTGSTIISHDAAGFDAHCPGADSESEHGKTSAPTSSAASESLSSVGSETSEGGPHLPPPLCSWVAVQPDESHAVPHFPGADLSSGRIEKKVCGASADDGTGMGSAVVDWRYVANGSAGGLEAPPSGPGHPRTASV